MKVALVFYPNLAKKDSGKNLIPVYMRIYYNRRKSEARLNIELNETDTSRWDPVTMRLQERNSAINHALNRLEQKFSDFILAHQADLPRYLPETIKNHVLGIEEKKEIKLSDFVDEYFEKFVLHNVNRTPGTIKNYRRAINHLAAFLKYNNRLSIPVDNVDVAFANDFKNFLVNNNPALDRIGMTEVSASTVIKKFRTIFTYAADLELIRKNPFKAVKIKTKSPRKERLSIDQVSKIKKVDISLSTHLSVYRDIFLFSVYTGLAYHDLVSLGQANLEYRADGNIKLSKSRQKTDIITECFLPSLAINIVEKYREQASGPEQRIFPYRSNKELNSQLKMLAQLAGIPIRLTMHTARHTFRQLLAEAGITDIGVIKRLMGQSRNGDVDEVYYSITDKALMNAKSNYDQYLNQYLE